MARWKKPKPKKQRSHIYRVPLLALKIYDSEEEAKAAADHCDRCDRQPLDEEWDDPKWVITLGMTEKGLLGIARFCPECLPLLEWGNVYAPQGITGPAFPIGITDEEPEWRHTRRDDEQQTA